MRINIPGIGLQDIDVDEIIGRASTIPRPPLNKKRPLPASRPIYSPIISGGFPSKKGPIFGISPSTPTTPEEQQMAREMAAQVFGGSRRKRPMPVGEPQPMLLEGSETINIPGVGPIQLPSTAPGSLNEEQTREILNEVVSSRLEDPFGNPFEGLGDRMREAQEADDVIYEFPDDPYAAYRNREDDDDEDTPPADFQSPSEYLSEQEMQNITTPNPSLTEEQLRQLYTSGMMDYDDDYFTDTEGMFGEAGQRYNLGVPQDRIDEIAQEINFSSNQPVETQPIKAPPAPPVNPFEGFVPRNIIGPSFDPKDVSAQQKMVADARARMTPGANIQGGGYLTYDNPILGNKQTQFGGYGQPMPTAPLMNYAGLSSPITYSTPAPDPDKEIIR